MYIVFGIVLFILVLGNIISHCAGINILLSLKHCGNGRIHLINLTNLSYVELISSIASLLTLVLGLIKFTNDGIRKEIEYHVNIVRACLLLTVYFLTMVVILVDKVLEVMMDIRYPVIWNERKAKILIISMWTFGICFSLCDILVHHITSFSLLPYFPTFFMLPANIAYLIFAIASYIYIFYKFNKSRILPYGGTMKNKALSFGYVFRRSRFFIPLSLIFIYVIFYVIPTIIFLCLNGVNAKKYIRVYIAISYNIAMLFDSWICVFLDPRVKLQLEKMSKIRRDRKDIERFRKQKVCSGKVHTVHMDEL